jgi:dGTPase
MRDNTFECFAADESYSKRWFGEMRHLYRNEFARDRDRILYSTEFRRLAGKTQVFVNGYDDNVRTRLTHTLEVSQIAQTICSVLGLNTDLAEAIALGHDLGHTPFGHIGSLSLMP